MAAPLLLADASGSRDPSTDHCDFGWASLSVLGECERKPRVLENNHSGHYSLGQWLVIMVCFAVGSDDLIPPRSEGKGRHGTRIRLNLLSMYFLLSDEMSFAKEWRAFFFFAIIDYYHHYIAIPEQSARERMYNGTSGCPTFAWGNTNTRASGVADCVGTKELASTCWSVLYYYWLQKE